MQQAHEVLYCGHYSSIKYTTAVLGREVVCNKRMKCCTVDITLLG